MRKKINPESNPRGGKLLQIFLPAFFALFALAAFLLPASDARAADEDWGRAAHEIWHHITISDSDVNSVDGKARNMWAEFERNSVQRGMLVKDNFEPFVPKVHRVILFDTPVGELAYADYSLRVETEVVGGKDVRITELTLSRVSDAPFPNARAEQRIGYDGGKLGKHKTYWMEQKKIVPDDLRAMERLKLRNFERAIEPAYTGGVDYRKVPIEDVFYFFPEISDSLKFSFGYLYPQNDSPMFRTTYEPGRIIFGSIVDSDVKISFLHNLITGKMVHGDISWTVSIGKYTTGEEIGMCESYFYFMQENLAKSGLIAPAVVAPF